MSRLCFFLSCAILWASVLAPSTIRAQASASERASPEAVGAKVQGWVRNTDAKPVADVTLSLQRKEHRERETLTVHTDAAGRYSFNSVPSGAYTLRAEDIHEGSAVIDPLILAPNEIRTADLILKRSPARQQTSTQPPDFFDEPHFTVAGVTDTTNLGGHGTEAIVRNRDEVAAAAALLAKKATSNPESANSSLNTAVEKQLRDEVERRPSDFSANYRLGKFMAEQGRGQIAIPYLEKAAQLNPHDYENAYQLALVYADVGNYQLARTSTQVLLNRENLSQQEKSSLHHLLADMDEKLNDALNAVREYQLAAEFDASESNLFDWGTELLTHRAAEPAIQVFDQGIHRFPHSIRMLEGLGAAYYSLGAYDKAAQSLCQASDLNPSDANPYLLMGKMQAFEKDPSPAVVDRLARFVNLQPQNALANYYYAMSLWQQQTSAGDTNETERVKNLLNKAVQIDPGLGLGYLQLGIVYSEQRDLPQAISAYQQAIHADPSLAQAHYRLARAYRLSGKTAQAQAELQLYENLSKEKTEATQRQRHELQQFVYQMRDGTTN